MVAAGVFLTATEIFFALLIASVVTCGVFIEFSEEPSELPFLEEKISSLRDLSLKIGIVIY